MRWILIGVCAVLALLVANAWNATAERPNIRPTADQAEKTEDTVAVAGSPTLPETAMSDYQEVGERPLFVQGRRPPLNEIEEAPKVEEKLASDPPAHLELKAVLIAGNSKTALVMNKQDESVERYAIGQEVDGWKLTRIDAESVQFTQGKTKHEIPLRVFPETVEAPPVPNNNRKARQVKRNPRAVPPKRQARQIKRSRPPFKPSRQNQR